MQKSIFIEINQASNCSIINEIKNMLNPNATVGWKFQRVTILLRVANVNNINVNRIFALLITNARDNQELILNHKSCSRSIFYWNKSMYINQLFLGKKILMLMRLDNSCIFTRLRTWRSSALSLKKISLDCEINGKFNFLWN